MSSVGGQVSGFGVWFGVWFLTWCLVIFSGFWCLNLFENSHLLSLAKSHHMPIKSGLKYLTESFWLILVFESLSKK